MLALALAAALRQTPPAAPPTIPIGTSPEFAQAAMAVESRLVEGDVEGARKAAQALPVRTPRIAFGGAALPPALASAREAGLAEVVKRWALFDRGFAPRLDPGAPDVALDLAPELPDGPDGIPLAARVDSFAPFHATVGLSRGRPGMPLRPEELNQEMAYVLGRYLGVPESPLPSAMRVDARPGLLTFFPRAEEELLAAQNLALADRLRAAAEAGRPLGLLPSSLRISKERLDLGDVPQGKPLVTRIELENPSAGTLEYRVTPDCGCFRPIDPGTVPPQGRGGFPVAIDTSEYQGKVEKLLLFESNDPARPRLEIPVTFRSVPAYRLVRPGGERVVVPETGGTYDFFLFSPAGASLKVTGARWDGMDAKLTWERWSGPLADPDMGEGARPRTGWRFHVRVAKGLPPGRQEGGLTVETDAPGISVAQASLYAQKGIVADGANLGDIVPKSDAQILVDRPNAPFKILGVDAGPYLKATWAARRGGWEYAVRLEYKGGAPKGDFQAPVRVRTDDPRQPVVETLARGFVK